MKIDTDNWQNYYIDTPEVIAVMTVALRYLREKVSSVAHPETANACDRLQEAIMWLESDLRLRN